MNEEEYKTMRKVEDSFWWYVGFRKIYAALIDRYCSTAASKHVLDAGCGTGSFLDFLKDRYNPDLLTGLDFSTQALDFCRERGFEDMICSSVVELPFEDERFDLVVSLDVLCHRSIPDDLVPLREFRRVLAPGGYTLLNLPAFKFIYSEHDLSVHTKHRYRRKELERMILDAGLEPVMLTYTNCFLFPAVASVRLVQKAFGGGQDKGNDEEHESDLRPLPKVINSMLTGILGAEAHLVTHFTLPFGSSITAIAKRP